METCKKTNAPVLRIDDDLYAFLLCSDAYPAQVIPQLREGTYVSRLKRTCGTGRRGRQDVQVVRLRAAGERYAVGVRAVAPRQDDMLGQVDQRLCVGQQRGLLT